MADEDVRPDPACDNHWANYQGALHEHFAANAARWPDRKCIVESASRDGGGREFSYRQVDEASNTLAHYLVDHGIQRGDVAMVYAHRGAETVVAVVGILKAGAAFATLDPAYPPDRQIVMLDVSRPRAIIAIERAGMMPADVTGWMRENLALLAEVSCFRLDANDASLGPDFSPYAARSTASPDIIIGPDDTPSITFTSGTTGRPKAVRGRHFMLTYSAAWWKQHLDLSENDRFSMLSGLAHDPLHRDMFTPLLLGASIVIPSADNFTDLAGWARHHRITFMHIMVTMTRVLAGSANGRKLDGLRVIFTGAERLYRRDCEPIRQLAPNAKLLNCYGATESGRSSCFYEIPPWNLEPDFLDQHASGAIPVGRGMQDSQVLIINRSTLQQCEIEEVGEIYLRGPGITEGYLSDPKQPQQNEEKFVTNWFVAADKWSSQAAHDCIEPWGEHFLGPRDRMYRTGDLGKYLSDGNVMCLGRCDNVVKIRGNRLELGEIDHLMLQHLLVKAHYTIQDERTQDLHTYYSPNLPRWREWYSEQQTQRTKCPESAGPRLRRRVSATEQMNIEQLSRIFQPLSEDIREFLATKLPAFGVPAEYIPMLHLPLTPNGKVNRQALPPIPAARRALPIRGTG